MHRVKVLKMFTIVTLLCVILLILTKGRLYRRNVDVITMDKGSNRSRKQFINPYLKNGSIVGKRSYFRMIESLSPKQLDELLLQFNVKGIQYLTKNAKLDFLWCDSEIRTGLPVSNRIRNCTEMTFKEDTGKRVALASFPGSGSTWSRTLLEQATGIYTGAVYCDRKLRGQGFLGEQITSRNVIAIKTHSGQGPRDRYDAVILVIRNIFDAVKSEINRRSSARNHTGIASDYDSELINILLVANLGYTSERHQFSNLAWPLNSKPQFKWQLCYQSTTVSLAPSPKVKL